MTIREIIIEIVRPLIKKQVRTGKARNINLNKCICDVELAKDLYLYGVKLKAIEGPNNTGVICEPKEGSVVQCAMVEGIETNWTIVQYSEVRSWVVIAEKSKLELKNNGEVHINGNNYGALIQIDKLVQRINAIEQKHDALVAEYNSHVHIIPVYAASLAPVPTAPTATPLAPSTNLIGTLTQAVDLANDKVKHGSGS